MINSDPYFTGQLKKANGIFDLMVDLFTDAKKCTSRPRNGIASIGCSLRNKWLTGCKWF